VTIRTTLIALVFLVTACGAQPTPPSPSAGASASRPASSASASLPAADALAGTWATGETTCAQQNAAVEAAGFTAEQMRVGGWDPTCAGGMPFGSQFTIRFAEGALVQFSDDEEGWDGVYRIVDEDTFEAGDNGNLYITYQYTIDGDELTIDMVEDNYPVEAEVIGDSLAQTVIYETAPFTREP
jgi:hypothetical protein